MTSNILETGGNDVKGLKDNGPGLKLEGVNKEFPQSHTHVDDITQLHIMYRYLIIEVISL